MITVLLFGISSAYGTDVGLVYLASFFIDIAIIDTIASWRD